MRRTTYTVRCFPAQQSTGRLPVIRKTQRTDFSPGLIGLRVNGMVDEQALTWAVTAVFSSCLGTDTANTEYHNYQCRGFTVGLVNTHYVYIPMEHISISRSEVWFLTDLSSVDKNLSQLFYLGDSLWSTSPYLCVYIFSFYQVDIHCQSWQQVVTTTGQPGFEELQKNSEGDEGSNHHEDIDSALDDLHLENQPQSAPPPTELTT